MLSRYCCKNTRVCWDSYDISERHKGQGSLKHWTIGDTVALFDLSTKTERVFLPIYTSLVPRLFLPHMEEETSSETRLNLDSLMHMSRYNSRNKFYLNFPLHTCIFRVNASSSLHSQAVKNWEWGWGEAICTVNSWGEDTNNVFHQVAISWFVWSHCGSNQHWHLREENRQTDSAALWHVSLESLSLQVGVSNSKKGSGHIRILLTKRMVCIQTISSIYRFYL